MRRLFTPHVNRIRACLEPGMSEITWTNFEWQEFTDRCLEDIDNFSYLMGRANDIYTNRIEKLLASMNYIKLHALPESQPWTLDKFLDEIKKTCRCAACDLHRVSMMIEDAVEDLIVLAMQSIHLDKNGVGLGDGGGGGGNGGGSGEEQEGGVSRERSRGHSGSIASMVTNLKKKIVLFYI